MRDVVKASLPIHVEAGLEGLKGAEMLNNGMTYGRGTPGKMHHDRIVERRLLRTYEKSGQDEFLEVFFKKVHANTGIERPPKLYGRW